jgi:opacity protein-like surface antigen
MKRCLLVFFAVCSASYGANDSVDRSENCTNCCDEKREAYAGAYVGAGLSYQHNKNDVTVSDNYADVKGAEAAAVYLFNGGLDQAEMDKEATKARNANPSANNLRLNGKTKGKIGGSVNVGYGKFVNSYLYCGADFVLDIAGKAKSSEETGRYKNTTVENSGVVPTLALRVGGYIPAIDSLVCARFGGAFVNTKSRNEEMVENPEIKIHKFTPVVGLSLEKNVRKNWSVKFEGDYRFLAQKEKLVSGTMEPFGVENRSLVKTKTRGYCVRLMSVYRFN